MTFIEFNCRAKIACINCTDKACARFLVGETVFSGYPERPNTVGTLAGTASLLVPVIPIMLMFLASVAAIAGSAGQGQPEVAYDVRCILNQGALRMEVRIEAKNLRSPLDELTLVLPDHGEWTEIDALYLRDVEVSPKTKRSDPGSNGWTFEPNSNWDGALRASYTIPFIERNSKLHERHGLLPHVYRAESGELASIYALSKNTLMRLYRQGKPISARISVRISNDMGWDIASGWDDAGKGEVAATFSGPMADTPIIAGKAKLARETFQGASFEVVQFAGGEGVAKALLQVAKKLIPEYGRSTGIPVDRTVRIYVIEKGGGQWLDLACLVQPPSPGMETSPYYLSFLAHELFHQWLGGYASPGDDSLVWLHEGFTDYLANWHLARAGLVSPIWFAERMIEIDREARTTPAFGKVSFADRSVKWRHDDNENYGYKGGATLAFCLDAELHKRKGPPLAGLVKALAADPAGRIRLETFESWARANGLGDLYDRFVAKPGLPDPRVALEQIGFRRRAVPLAYLGIATTPGQGRGTVRAIDPEGPAAKSGIKVGDVIADTSERLFYRPEPVQAETEFRFGLELFDPAKGPVRIDVRRGEERHSFTLTPRAFGEGRLWEWPESAVGAGFFTR